MSLLAPSTRAGIVRHEHVQSAASTTWIIDHNRGKWPWSALCYLDDGSKVEPTLTNPTLNRTVITHENQVSGKALLLF